MNKFDILYDSFMTEMLSKNRWKSYHLVVESVKDKLLPYPIWIYDNQLSILTEDKQIFSSIAKNIFNAKTGTVFAAKHILENIPNFDINGVEYANIPIVKYTISFKSIEPLKIILSKHKKDIPKQYRDFVINTFDTNDKANGLFLASYATCIIIILNKEESDILTIQHELYHYCQFLSGLNMIDPISKFDKNKIKNLQLSDNELAYLFAPQEFFAHIDIDLQHQCKAIHKKYFNSISYKNFVDKLIDEIKTDRDRFIFSDIGVKFITIFSYDTSAIRLFAATFCLGLNDLWNEACKRLKGEC